MGKFTKLHFWKWKTMWQIRSTVINKEFIFTTFTKLVCSLPWKHRLTPHVFTTVCCSALLWSVAGTASLSPHATLHSVQFTTFNVEQCNHWTHNNTSINFTVLTYYVIIYSSNKEWEGRCISWPQLWLHKTEEAVAYKGIHTCC